MVKLANWTARRHNSYKQLMARVHKFIVAIAIAEKEEREKAAKIEKTTLGYDPSKAIKSNGTIRKEDSPTIRFANLQLPPPVKGKHKFKHCQCMYEQAHSLLATRRWAFAHPESDAGGITWTELFILFDTAGGRTTKGQHERSTEAAVRARKKERQDEGGQHQGRGGDREGHLG